MKHVLCAALAVAWAAGSFSPANADVVISTDPTSNMNCASGLCTPTATNAVLNTNDLQGLLANGNVEVTTNGSGVQAGNIDIESTFTWGFGTTLALDAHASVVVASSIEVSEGAGLSLTTNDGGNGGLLQFQPNGQIAFSGSHDALAINGTKYKLEATIRSLTYDIVRNPAGAFALTEDIDAKNHLYRASPIPITFTGAFNGLGHVISNLEIVDMSDSAVGFFAGTASPGSVNGIGIKNALVIGNGNVGALIGAASGSAVTNAWATGDVKGNNAAGVLAGAASNGTIIDCWSAGTVTGGGDIGGLIGSSSSSVSGSSSAAATTGSSIAGGLVGASLATIDSSFATGTVRLSSTSGTVGGLVATSGATISNSYATGKVASVENTFEGGLVGQNNAQIISAYSAGKLTGFKTHAGAFIGDNSNGAVQSGYWDTSRNKGFQGVGEGNDTGVIGLTTKQFRAALPDGLDPSVWAESPGVNNGFPYLIANPPQH